MQRTVLFGPPGTGKTTALLRRVESFIEQGIPPERIAYVSFTKRAVEEARQRACDKFGLSSNSLPWFKTLHSTAFALLGMRRDGVMSFTHWRELGALLGYRFQLNAEASEDTDASGKGDKLIALDSLARNRLVSVEQQWHDSRLEDVTLFEVSRFTSALRRFKEARDVLDFTDMLEQGILQQLALPVDVLIIDEAQDLTPLQWRFIDTVYKTEVEIITAGDDDQAIYRWSGAEVDYFQARDGDRTILQRSYRVPAQVQTFANQIIGRVGNRVTKNWIPRAAEGSVERAAHAEAVDLGDSGTWLFLARNILFLAGIEEVLTSRGIPFTRRGGDRSIKLKHAQGIVAYERLRKGTEVGTTEVKAMLELGPLRLDPVYERAKVIPPGAIIGLQEQRPWFEALDGIPFYQREYYRAVLRSGYKLNEVPRVGVNTIHGVKGGEADHVAVLPDMTWRSFQGWQEAPDDELRVWYVGATRARETLTLLDPVSQNFAPLWAV